jgi:hypothetical protein
MINLARRCRQVWLGWRSWPLFRLTAWIIAIWWLLMVVDERLQAWPSHNLNVGHWITSIRDGLALPLYLTPVALMMAVPMLHARARFPPVPFARRLRHRGDDLSRHGRSPHRFGHFPAMAAKL